LKTCLRQSARGELAERSGEERRGAERKEEMSLARSNERAAQRKRERERERERARGGRGVQIRARNPCNAGTYAYPDCVFRIGKCRARKNSPVGAEAEEWEGREGSSKWVLLGSH
jgi:hypothetical protein